MSTLVQCTQNSLSMDRKAITALSHGGVLYSVSTQVGLVVRRLMIAAGIQQIQRQCYGLLTYQLLMCTFGVPMAATGSKDHRLISEREREKRLPHLRTAAGA